MKAGQYTTALSKGLGMISETLALMRIWDPSMSLADLKAAAVRNGVIGRATALRVKDIVGRVFGTRYLCDGGAPARQVKALLTAGVPPARLSQILLIHTARAHPVLHDFITDTYWPRYAAGARRITRQDARRFLERAADTGRIEPRWSDTMMSRVSGYLTGCLTDFQFAGDHRSGIREIRPPSLHPLTSLYLAHDLHFSGFGDRAVITHEDWQLFGLPPFDVRRTVERVANGHLIPQLSGDLVRITWHYQTMEEALRGIIATEL